MIQKLFLTGIIVLIFPGETFQVIVVALANLHFMAILYIMRPHLPGSGRSLAMAASFAITLTMDLALILKTVPEASKKYENVFQDILIVTNGSVALYTIWLITAPFVHMLYTRARFKKSGVTAKKRPSTVTPFHALLGKQPNKSSIVPIESAGEEEVKPAAKGAETPKLTNEAKLQEGAAKIVMI
jgi:hypothetical protein